MNQTNDDWLFLVKLDDQIKSKGVTMTALLAKATALALVQHPVVNSSCRDGKSFTYNSSINIAVAVAIDGGLITPVLQDADKVSDLALYSIQYPVMHMVDVFLVSSGGHLLAFEEVERACRQG